MLTLQDRVVVLVLSISHPLRRWSVVENFTGISRKSWIKACTGKQRPTAEMIEALGKAWPQYAFWLVTGYTDVENGHICPETVPPLVEAIGMDGFPGQELFDFQKDCAREMKVEFDREFGTNEQKDVDIRLKVSMYKQIGAEIRINNLDYLKEVRARRNEELKAARNIYEAEISKPGDVLNRDIARRLDKFMQENVNDGIKE